MLCHYLLPLVLLFSLSPCVLPSASLYAQEEQIPDPDEYIEIEREPTCDLQKLQRLVVYPMFAKKKGIEGELIVRILVGIDSLPKKCEIMISANRWLDTAAIEAVMKAPKGTFIPAFQKGEKPVAVWLAIPMTFRLLENNDNSTDIRILTTPTNALLFALTERIRNNTSSKALHYYNRGLVYHSLGKKREALADFAQARRIDSSTTWTPYNNAGIKELVRIDIDETDAPALTKRGELMMAFSPENAIIDFSSAIEADSIYTYAYAFRAAAYYTQGLWKDAQQDFLRVRKSPSLLPQQKAMLGHCYYEMKDYEEAVDILTQAIEDNPQLTASYYLIALSFLRMDEDYDDVREAFEKAKTADNNNLTVRTSFIHALQQLAAQGIRATEAQQILREVFHIE